MKEERGRKNRFLGFEWNREGRNEGREGERERMKEVFLGREQSKKTIKHKHVLLLFFV